MFDIQAADAELTLTLEGMLRAANDLTTEKEGYVLDARQGKVLNEQKLDRAQVLDHLAADEPGCALDARQGKWLNENKLGTSDIVNDLETAEPSKALSAAQGALLGAELNGLSASMASLARTVEALSGAVAQKPELSSIYRVGDIHISTGSQSPAAIYGGTWEQLKDRFLLAAGSTYAAGSTGGEASHTLSASEMPAHYHDLAQQNSSGTTKLGLWDTYIKSSYQVLDQVYDSSQNIKAYTYGTRTAGSGAAHNNMPPYLAVYIWRRVA